MTSTAAGPATGGWRDLTVTGGADRPGVVPIRPLTLGDLLDEPFVLLRAHLRSILLFTAAAVVPSQLLQGYLARGTLSAFDLSMAMSDPEAMSAALGAEGGGGGVGIAVAALNGLLLLPLAYALVTRLALSSVLGEHLGDAQVVRAVRGRLPAVYGAWLLAFAAIAALPVLGVVVVLGADPIAGGLLVMIGVPVAFGAFALLSLAPMIALVEGRGPVASLRRSVGLVRRRLWSVCGALGLALTVSLLVQMALGGLPSAIAFALPGDAAWIVASAGSTIAGLVATPYTMLVIALVYLDALVRVEALDVQRLLDPPERGVRAAR